MIPRSLTFPKYLIIEQVRVPVETPIESFFRIYERKHTDISPKENPQLAIILLEGYHTDENGTKTDSMYGNHLLKEQVEKITTYTPSEVSPRLIKFLDILKDAY